MSRGSKVGRGSRRVRWTEGEARRVLRAFERSGLVQAEFCRRQRLDPQRLTRWRQTLEARASARRPRVRPVVVIDDSLPTGHAGFELELAGGARLRIPVGFEESSLGRLLGLLGARP